MKDGDVRDVCLALVKQISGSSELGRVPQPAALGWKLEHQGVSVEQLSTWCEALLQERGAGAAPALRRRWLASPPLRAFLAEYREVVARSERPTVSSVAVTSQRGRRDDRQRA